MEGEVLAENVGDPTVFQPGSIMDKFRNALNKNSEPAIDNMAKVKEQVSPPLVGDHFDPKSVPFNPGTKSPIKFVSEEEEKALLKRKVALWNEIKAYIADTKKSYPTLPMPAFTYKNKSVACGVGIDTLQNHFEEYQRVINKLIPEAKAEMKALEVIAQKKADEKIKAATQVIAEESQLDAINEANNSMSYYEEENINPMEGVVDTPQNQADQMVAKWTPGIEYFGENCYAIEYGAARYKLAVQRANGIDMPTTVPALERNKEKIIDAWQGVGEKYKDSFVVKILNDPIAKLAAAHTEPILAFFDDLNAVKKIQQPD